MNTDNESKIIESNNCNVYGIDKEKFYSIVQFIDNKIVLGLQN